MIDLLKKLPGIEVGSDGSITSGGETKMNDNSSTATHTGSTGSVAAISAAELQQMLAREGVRG